MPDVIHLASPPAIVESVVSVPARAKQVLKKLLGIKAAVDDNFFTVCDLLLEAQEGDYHTVFGFSRFADWIDQSDLDISSRQAFYMLTLSKKARTLGLSRDELKKVKISKLKEIFALEPDTYGEEMRQLVADAVSLSLEEVKERVSKLRTKDGGTSYVYMTIKVEAAIKETIKQAFELARRSYGSVVQNGEVADISDTRCMELICVAFLQDPNNSLALQNQEPPPE